MGKGVGVAPVVMALGGGLLAGLAIHDYMQNGDIGLAGILELATGTLLFIWGALFLLGYGRKAVKLGFRMAKASALGIFILVVILGLMGYAIWKGSLSIPGYSPPSEEVVTGDVPLDLPIKFVIRNKLTGAAFNPTSAELYNSMGYVVETLTVTSGSATTAGSYKSGEQYYLKITDGTAFYFVAVALPYYDKEIAEIKPPDFHVIAVDAPDVPSALTVKAIDATGTVVTTLNITASTPITIMVTNSEADTALPGSFYNPVMESTYGDYLVITVTGSGSVIPRISGAQLVFQTSGQAVYVIQLSGLDCKTDPRTGSATPVSKSYGVTIDPTGVPTGSYTVTITAYVDLDQAYIQSYGVANTDAVQLGSTSVTVNV
jgi:hypothetical protein